jgi:serine/threonine protein kinase
MSPAAIEEYEREKEMLLWIRHPNIVRLSQSFTIDQGGVKEYCMLLPLAECSLFEYLRESTTTSRQERLAFMLEHLSSITGAIEYVHRKYKSPSGDESTGFNHDIKPRNILLFQSRDGRSKIFRLCDWGLGQFHGLQSGSGTTVREPSDPAYTPPERDVESGLGIRKVSRSADVWSWGCVILEILVWITFGPEGVENFFKARESEYHDKQVSVARFWDVLPNANGAEELQPNPAVVRMFEILRQDSDHTCRRLLSVVESMMKLKADDRIPIEEAVDEIYKIRLKATYSQHIPSYCWRVDCEWRFSCRGGHA